ncbi:glycosyltransferase family 4 protein [Ramlibacter tataouinensis]|uniref:glycosyltransferase family 4 protein n=1 Tax=Ramlibacter tataouinensis TaxID=94132 RepID=UPI0022F3CB2B|nr:glycosyltransferase family 4 protein [Ramlibacter tataouinensis]WBY02635.1 glycosyltransferase family 4 protein [Ramlibacter tataouinensis]
MGGEQQPSILLTADTVGGVWTYAVELARALGPFGIDVHLATMGGPLRAHQRDELDRLPHVSLHESRFALEWMPDPWREVDAAADWLLALERRWQPQLVHLNQFAFGALPFAAPTLLVAHSCVPSWWRAVHGTRAPAGWDGYRGRVAAGLRGAGLVAAPTAAMLAALRAEHGFHGEAVVLPNGRDPALFPIGAKEPFVFAAGRFWDEAKNLAALQAVAPRLPWPVCVAGSCVHPDGRELRPAGVQALGELAPREVAAHMACASIYALPAYYEPFGLSVLEAALSGCALVLGDIASLREVWGDAAVYVKPDDTLALHEVLQQLIARPDPRSRLAAAAHRRALRFSPRAMAEAWFAAAARLAPALAGRPEELPCA